MKEYKCKIKCGDCCRKMYIPFGDGNETDWSRWIKLHEGLEIIMFRGLECIVLNKVCSKLKNNKCTIYKDRPKMCKEFRCDK